MPNMNSVLKHHQNAEVALLLLILEILISLDITPVYYMGSYLLIYLTSYPRSRSFESRAKQDRITKH